MIQRNTVQWRKRVQISVATEGWIRYEWAHARFGQIIPVNWAATGFDLGYTAMGYSIDDAYNMIARQALIEGVDWVLIIEDDVLLPMDCFVRMAQYMDAADTPVVSGLYYTKATPAEPLIFRGRGNGVFRDWEQGERVWCDGLPMGCLLVHTSILAHMADTSEEYRVPTGEKVKRIFHTPRSIEVDPVTGVYQRQEGTQDLWWCDRLINEGVFAETGWDEIAEREYPLLVDTQIFCRHIDRGTGRQYPIGV